MVSLPGWGGCWEHRERLESGGSEIAKNRYKPVHPRVQHTKSTKRCNASLTMKRRQKARDEEHAADRAEALRLARAVPEGDNEFEVREAAWQRGEFFPRSNAAETFAVGSGRYSS